MGRKNSLNYELRCKYCDKPFRASRPDAEFHSVNCRNAYHRFLNKLEGEKDRAISAFDILIRNSQDPKYASYSVALMFEVEQAIADKMRATIQHQVGKALDHVE